MDPEGWTQAGPTLPKSARYVKFSLRMYTAVNAGKQSMPARTNGLWTKNIDRLDAPWGAAGSARTVLPKGSSLASFNSVA